MDSLHIHADNYTELHKSALDLNINIAIVKSFRLGRKPSTESDIARRLTGLFTNLKIHDIAKSLQVNMNKLIVYRCVYVHESVQ